MEEILLKDYLMENRVEDKDLTFYHHTWKYDPIAIIEPDKQESLILQEGRKWFVVDRKERRNSIDLLVEENPTYKIVNQFINRIVSTYDLFKLSKEEASLMEFHVSLVYSSYDNELFLNFYFEKGFVDVYKMYVSDIKKKLLTIEKRFDEDYIIFKMDKIGDFNLLTKKENFLKEGGDMDWVEN